jgi:hypothetical protein
MMARGYPVIPENTSPGNKPCSDLLSTFRADGGNRQFFVDVSELAQRDIRTRCQGVTRSIVLPIVNAIWIGPRLGQIHVACLRSFVAHGHRVVLYCYEPPEDTPKDVELADANTLLPASRLIRHKQTGSLSLFSDLLRYELLKTGAGLYVDCDVFCVRPIEDSDYIFGWQTRGELNTAVLKLPPNCPALASLTAIKDTANFVPPWLPPRRKWWRRPMQKWFRSEVARSLEELPWGTLGPTGFTYYAKQHELDRYGSPIDRFYPVNWEQVPLLLDPGLLLSDLLTPRTDAVHLFAFSLGQLERGIPKGSPLSQIVALS